MKTFFRSLLSERHAGALIGVIALCLVLWLFGATLFGSPMQPTWVRILCVLAVVALWIAFEGFKEWRRSRANARMLEKLKKDQRAVPDVADAAERPLMREELDRLFDALKSEEIGRGASRGFLESLPYYLVVGPPGSGKASLIENAGFNMPLRGRLGGQDIRINIGGEHTHWWFTDDGLLISASPKALLGDDAGNTRANAWRGLLGYLKDHRPRHPLDAIVLVIGVDVLLSAGAKDFARYARARRQEAITTFGIAVPVYLVVSKCDLLVGFTEYFAALDEEARNKAFGATVPVPKERHQTGEVASALRGRLDHAMQASARLLPFRLAAERSAERRATLLALPEQLATLTEATISFVAEFTRIGRHDHPILFRGVFFASAGTMEGAHPEFIDTWRARFATPLGLIPPSTAPSAAKPCFAGGIFRDFVFPEAGIGGRNPMLERRIALLHTVGYLACAFVLLASLSIWFSEFHDHQRRLGIFRAGAVTESSLDRNFSSERSLASVLPLLDEAAKLGGRERHPSLFERIVGFTAFDIRTARASALGSYHRLLEARYLPLLVQQLEEQLQTAVAAGDDLNRIRSLLTVYLMLGDPTHYNSATVAGWGNGLIATAFALQPTQRADALAHWQQLLDLMPTPVALNAPLIAEARSLLQARPTAEAIYAELQSRARRSGAAVPLNVVAALGQAGSQLLMLRSQAGLSVVVPGLYTRQGFYGIFLKQAPLLVQQAVAGNWVTGSFGAGNPATTSALLEAVTQDYVRDYIKEWRSVLDQIVLRALPDLPSLVSGLQVLASPQSPVLELVALVKNQTDLPPVAPAASPLTKLVDTAKAKAQAAPAAVKSAAQQVAGTSSSASPFANGSWPGEAIREPFEPLLSLVAGGAGQTPALAVQNAITAAYGVVSGIAAAQSPADAAATATARVISNQAGDPLIQLRVQAATLPPPVDDIFRALYRNTWSVLLGLTGDHIEAAWSHDVAPACEQAIAGRFPFASSGQSGSNADVTLRDFANFFGPRGVLDSFVTKDLAPFTTTSSTGDLNLAAANGLRLSLPQNGLAQINRARRVQRLFFDANGNLGLSFSLTPAYLDPRVLSATLSLDQTSLVYQHQPPRTTEFHWPAQASTGSATLTLALVNGKTIQKSFSGPWALFRLFDIATTTETGGTEQLKLSFTLEGYRENFILNAGSVSNPFANGTFTEFRCVPRL